MGLFALKFSFVFSLRILFVENETVDSDLGPLFPSFLSEFSLILCFTISIYND